jgi:hypothetical protein
LAQDKITKEEYGDRKRLLRLMSAREMKEFPVFVLHIDTGSRSSIEESASGNGGLCYQSRG